jgi:signal transduction histidine kinase
MTAELRNTGIDVVGGMPWGTHFCLFYETKDDLLDALVPYFKAGLESREFCVWAISDPLTEEDARNALNRAVPAFDRYLADCSMEILPGREWYLKGDQFDIKKITSGWDQKLQSALAKGYAGMRVSGNAFWLDTKYWKDFLDYEHELDDSLADQPMAVLCTYPLTASSPADVLDVARAHQFTIARRKGNWEIIETPELKQAKQEIQKLNQELEQRVLDRTQALEAANHALRTEMANRARAEERLQTVQGELARMARIATVGELAGAIAHEINQPLTAIISGGGSALRWLNRQKPKLDEAKAAVQRIVRDGNRAAEVVAHIRALLKKDKPNHVDVDLNDAIREVIALTRGERGARHVSLRTELFADLPTVRGDRIQLQQVVLNLILNAVEATSAIADTPRSLSIRTQRGEDGGVLVAVEDTGVGIDPAAAIHVFEPFFTTKADGMGMGLAISRSIVESHGGCLWIAPASPHGAIVCFSLPGNHGAAS